MKYILSIILISLILTSCSMIEKQQSIVPLVPVIQSGTIQADTIASSTSINTGIISTGSIVAKIRTLGMENNNVILLEDGKKLDSLTTKGNIDFSNVENCDIPKEKTAYKILQTTGEYGVVQKVKNTCGGGALEKVYYSIPLTSNADVLQEIYIGLDTVKVNGSTIGIINADEVVNTENEEGMGMVAKSTLIKEGYKQQGKDWVKTISLGTIKTTPQNTAISTVSMDSIVGKYSKLEPLQDGYSTDASIEIKQGKSSDYSVIFSATYIQPNTINPIKYDGYGTMKKEGNVWKFYGMERAPNLSPINCEAEFTFDNKKLVIKQIALKPDPKLIGTTQCSVLNEKGLIKK